MTKRRRRFIEACRHGGDHFPQWRVNAICAPMLHMLKPLLYRAEGLEPIVEIADDGELFATLEKVMLGWGMVLCEAGEPHSEPAVKIARDAKGWVCSGATFDKPITYRDPVATACGLIAALYKAHTLIDRESLVLHAAGVRVGTGLVLLIGHYRAGKTVLATACAAAGLQVFSDDIIPLDPVGPVARAVGLGIRLRLPLPDNLDPVTREFIAAHRIASSDRYAYIRPPRVLLAWHGESAPITGIVALRRCSDSPAHLRRLAPEEALSEAIRRNFARETLAGKILDILDGLTARVPCLELTYSDTEEAVTLLRNAFEGAGPEIPDQAPPQQHSRKSRTTPLYPDDTRIARVPGVQARLRGGQAFLTDIDESTIFNLNSTGSAVWRALDQPVTFHELAGMFAAAFPDQDRDELAKELSHLIHDLSRGGLVTVT